MDWESNGKMFRVDNPYVLLPPNRGLIYAPFGAVGVEYSCLKFAS
jgi:hypothetical protein